jgi:nicotinamide mononucleotide adenylyltransferase
MTFVSIKCDSANSANSTSSSYGDILNGRNNVTTTGAKKIVYVGNGMPKKEEQWHLFIGRWQPLQLGHKKIFEQILKDGGNVCIAIRDGEIDEKNPFTANEVYQNIREEYYDNIYLFKNILLIIIRDFSSANIGSGVGYHIAEYVPPTKMSEISANEIREQMKIEL